MAELIHDGKAIRLQSADPRARRGEWRPWRSKGYRVPDPDGITVWEEEEGLRRLVLRAFEGVDADVFLFGSRARGGATARSDWDIGYRCVSEPPRAVLVRLEETLEELPIPVRVELVDFRDVPQEFRRVVLAQGVKVWKKASRNSLFTSTS